MTKQKEPKRLKEEIRKDGKKCIDVARGITKIELGDNKDGWAGEKYEEEFVKRVNNYKTYISKYSSGENQTSRTNIFELIQKFMSWSDKRLQFALSPKDGDGDNNHEIPEEKELLEQGWEYVALEVDTIAIYADNNILEVTKKIRIKSLVNNLEKIENLTYFRVVRKGGNEESYIESYYPKSLIEVKSEKAKADKIYTNIFLKKSLNKGQEITIIMHHLFKQVIDDDRTCHYTQILCPTYYMRLTVTPPSYINKSHKAELCEHRHKKESDWQTRNRGKFIEMINLDESGNYNYERAKPPTYYSYEIHWGGE